MEQRDRPIAFVAFRYEEFTARVPVRIGPENRNLCPDVMRWMQSAFAQNVGGHRRRRGLAVHPNDKYSALGRHNRGQGFGAADSFLSRFLCAFQNWIVRFDRGRIDDELGVARVRGTML